MKANGTNIQAWKLALKKLQTACIDWSVTEPAIKYANSVNFNTTGPLLLSKLYLPHEMFKVYEVSVEFRAVGNISKGACFCPRLLFPSVNGQFI